MSNLQEYFGALTPARDRRLHTRTTPASLTYVELRDTNGGMVLNISETGMAVAVADVFLVGEYLPHMRFPLPISSHSIELSAQVVWLAESKSGAGFRFVDLTPDARNQISNWIASEKPILEFEQLPKPLRRSKQPLDISSRKSPPSLYTSCTVAAAGIFLIRFTASAATRAGQAVALRPRALRPSPAPESWCLIVSFSAWFMLARMAC